MVFETDLVTVDAAHFTFSTTDITDRAIRRKVLSIALLLALDLCKARRAYALRNLSSPLAARPPRARAGPREFIRLNQKIGRNLPLTRQLPNHAQRQMTFAI
jgi:hypothetical protein